MEMFMEYTLIDDVMGDEEGFTSLDDIIGDDEDEWVEFGEEDF